MKSTINKPIDVYYCDVCGNKFEPNDIKYHNNVFTIHVEETKYHGSCIMEHVFFMGKGLDICPCCMVDFSNSLINDLGRLEEKYKNPRNWSTIFKKQNRGTKCK